MTATVGETFGPYEILGKLGRGGMGDVYRGWDARLHREVAIKMLHNDYSIPGMRERFLQEARAASALNHPNICTVFDIGEHEGAPYLVMEMMEGETLRVRIEHSPIPVEDIVHWSCEITEALGAAHARGIIHRDIKPANIYLVDKPTGGCQIKVLDFGLAKMDHAIYGAFTNRDRPQTSEGATVGTVAYMSPEQARGEPLDARSDLFSLGVVMYEMATRHLPFQGNTSALVFVQLLERAPEAIRDWNDAIPKELEKLILRLLEKDRAARYQSATEVAAAFTRLTAKGSSGWFSRGSRPAVPLVRAEDPVARAKRPVRRQSSAPYSGERQLSEAGPPASALRRRADDSEMTLRPLAQAPVLKADHASQEIPRPGSPEARSVGETVASPMIEIAAASKSGASAATSRQSVVSEALGLAGAEEKADESAKQDLTIVTAPGRLARRRRRIRMIAATATGLVAAGTLVFFVQKRLPRAPLVGRYERVMVTAIENHTGDKSLDGTIAQSIELELQQSPYFTTRGLGAYRAALRQLGMVADQPSTPVLARQAAQATGARAYLYGAIQTKGSDYILTVTVADSVSNRTLASAEQAASSREQLGLAVDHVVETLRSDLGEDSESLSVANVPLRLEASSNIEALHAYRTGREAAVEGRTDDAIAAYRQAALLDPNFAAPQIQLSWMYRAKHAEVASAEAARSAQASVASASPYSKLYTRYAYEMNATGDLGHAAEIIRQFLVLYPHDPGGELGLARVLRLQGLFTEASDSARKGIVEDPSIADLYGQAETSMIALDRYDTALSLEAQSRARALAHEGITLSAAYLGHKDDILANALADVTRPPYEPSLVSAYGLYLDNIGQIAAGTNLWSTAAGLGSTAPQTADAETRWLLAQGALDSSLEGNCAGALAMARRATMGSNGATASYHLGIAAGLCGERGLADQTIAGMTHDFPKGTMAVGYYLPGLKAAEALGQNDPQGAIDALKATRTFDQLLLAAYLQGLAHLALRQPQLAIVDFEGVLGHRGLALTGGSNVYPMAQIGVARAFAASGDQGNSVQAYRRFLEEWKNGDANQPLKREATEAITHRGPGI